MSIWHFGGGWRPARRAPAARIAGAGRVAPSLLRLMVMASGLRNIARLTATVVLACVLRPRSAVADEAQPITGCHPIPAHRRVVKLNLKPDTNVADLVAWISAITCRQFLLPGTIATDGKRVTIYSPQLISADEAFELFLAALDSVGLTVQESGRFYRIIEAAKAKSTPVPLYGVDGEVLFDGANDR